MLYPAYDLNHDYDNAMAKAQYLTLATVTDLLNPQSLYLVLYGWLLGMCMSTLHAVIPHQY